MKKRQKIIYLTIDDCPSRDCKAKIDFLLKNKIPAILFCIGKRMERHPEDIVYAIKNGFIIGNHSYRHPHFPVVNLARVEREIALTDIIINNLHKKAKVKRKIKIFRFPYGERGFKLHNGAIQKILKKYGYKQPKFKNINYPFFKKLGFDKSRDIFWTYDISEFKIKKLKQVLLNIRRKRGNLNNLNSHDIVLIHDHSKTTKRFFKIIEKMLKKGIKFEIPKVK